MPVHLTAIVDPHAGIAASAEIGPYCIVGPEVEIGSGTRLMANVYVEGPTRIGSENVFFPFSSIGAAPQDLKYQGERSETRIGHRNTIREFVTIHRGTQGGGLVTQIGDDNLLMAYVHVAHDVKIGNHTVLSNAVTFAGHVVVQDWAVIGAFCGVHQYCRVGSHAIVGGYSVITQDVLPFSVTATARDPKVFGENKVGLERRGFDSASIQALHRAFRLLAKAGLNTSQAIERIEAEIEPTPQIEELVAFMRAAGRGFIK